MTENNMTITSHQTFTPYERAARRLHHNAYFEAAKRWREETGGAEVFPDLSGLLKWLISRAEKTHCSV
jgi:hypothetical protein